MKMNTDENENNLLQKKTLINTIFWYQVITMNTFRSKQETK